MTVVTTTVMQQDWTGTPERRAVGHSFARRLHYPSIVATSEKVSWTVDEVFRNRIFDPSQPIVPTSWLDTEGCDFLNEGDQLKLNHCRAFSYVHLLGNFEELLPLHLAEIAGQCWHGERA